MRQMNPVSKALLLAACLNLGGPALAPAQAPAPPPAKKKAAPRVDSRILPKPDAKAIEILKASCAKLAAAGSMSFTALGAYEVPSLWGPPLIYGRVYEVVLQRPGRLAVLTVGDGPRTEFYDDGKVMMSFHPAETSSPSPRPRRRSTRPSRSSTGSRAPTSPSPT